MAGGAQAKMSTWFSKTQSKFDFKGDQKKGRIQPENFCVCAPENCPQDKEVAWGNWTLCYAGNLLEDGQRANQTERRVVGTVTRRFIPRMNVVSTE